MASRYDQLPLEQFPYGHCADCDLTLMRPDVASAHQRSARHDIVVDNPSREDRVFLAINSVIEQTYAQLTGYLQQLVATGELTAAEVTDNLELAPAISTHWKENDA